MVSTEMDLESSTEAKPEDSSKESSRLKERREKIENKL